MTAGEWAQNVCGAVGVWRGQIEAIVEDIRTPSGRRRGGRGAAVGDAAGPNRPRADGSRAGRAGDGDDGRRHGQRGHPDTPKGRRRPTQVSTGQTRRSTISSRRRSRSTRRPTRSRRPIEQLRRRSARSARRSRAACRRSPTSRGPIRSSRPRCMIRAPVSNCERRRAREHDGLDPRRGSGPRRHRLHRPRRALGRHRPRPLGRRRHARSGLRLRARPRRAADQRDPDHHRGHLGGGRDAGGRRRRLHGADRERRAAGAAEGAQLRRARTSRTCSRSSPARATPSSRSSR